MITGDYGITAEAIAKRIGLETNNHIKMIAGEQLKHISDIQLVQICMQP